MTAVPSAPHGELALVPLELLIEPSIADRSLPEAPLETCEPVRDDDPEPTRITGCGWFDSSLDLQEGLRVVELRLPERWPLDPPPWARH